MMPEMLATGRKIYEERLSSPRTLGLFAGLTLLFLILFLWRISTATIDAAGFVLFLLFGLFLFYSLNDRMLVIRLTSEVLKLKFGIIPWTIPPENIQKCQVDDLSPWKRYGGAGIHFMSVRGRYRASLNFLEYPRVVVILRKRAGMVRDVSFSTRRPDDLIRLVQEAVKRHGAPEQPARACPVHRRLPIRIDRDLVDLQLRAPLEHLPGRHPAVRLLEGVAIGPGPEALFVLPEGEHDEVISLHRAEDHVADKAGVSVHQAAPGTEALEKCLFVPLGHRDTVLYDDHGVHSVGFGVASRLAGESSVTITMASTESAKAGMSS
jgi:hypothetical protein